MYQWEVVWVMYLWQRNRNRIIGTDLFSFLVCDLKEGRWCAVKSSSISTVLLLLQWFKCLDGKSIWSFVWKTLLDQRPHDSNFCQTTDFGKKLQISKKKNADFENYGFGQKPCISKSTVFRICKNWRFLCERKDHLPRKVTPIFWELSGMNLLKNFKSSLNSQRQMKCLVHW